VLTDAHGIPLHATVTAANVNEVTHVLDVLAHKPAVGGKPGRNREHGSGLGKLRWFVERTISWLHGLGRLRRRLDRLTDIHEAFLRLACSLICLRFLTS
jgi:hypothetical protein